MRVLWRFSAMVKASASEISSGSGPSRATRAGNSSLNWKLPNCRLSSNSRTPSFERQNGVRMLADGAAQKQAAGHSEVNQ
jgi:hypothetical protein